MKNSIKVCIVCATHNALDGRVFFKQALTLNKAGYEVTLICPISEDGYFCDNGGYKVLKADGDGQLLHNGVRLIGYRVKRCNLRRVRYFINFRPIVKAISEIGVELDAAVYHCHEPDMALVAGYVIKKELLKRGRSPKLIYDAHEYWPGKFQEQYLNSILNGIISKYIFLYLERYLLKSCDFVFTASQIIRGHILLQNRYKKVEVIHNCPLLPQDGKTQRADATGHVICHDGIVTFNRGLVPMIKVFEKLRRKFPEVKFRFVGLFKEKEREWIEKEISKYHLEEAIIFSPWVSYGELGEEISKGSIGVSLMQEGYNTMLGGVNNKIFNYMMYGLPIVASDLPRIREIVEEANCGILVSNENEFYDALAYLLQHPEEARELGEKGYQAARQTYNWENFGKKLVRVYDKLTRRVQQF